MNRRLTFVIVTLGCAALTACTSPEASRTRGERRSGEGGNRRANVLMHEGSDPYWRTPVEQPVEHPPLAPARQARELSRQ